MLRRAVVHHGEIADYTKCIDVAARIDRLVRAVLRTHEVGRSHVFPGVRGGPRVGTAVGDAAAVRVGESPAAVRASLTNRSRDAAVRANCNGSTLMATSRSSCTSRAR